MFVFFAVRLLLLAGSLAFSRAEAATVAVLDFQSWGASQSDTDVATDAVRSALLTGGVLDALPGSDIAAGVSASTEGDLRAAREHASEARRLYLAGDYVGAVTAATEAVREHETALSGVGRRAELADAWYTLGVAGAKSKLDATAEDAFAHVAALYPRYLEERAVNIPAAVKPLLAAAEADVRPAAASRAEIAAVILALHVDWVITGSLDADGALELTIWAERDGGVQLIAQLQGFNVPLPATEVDLTWDLVAAEIGKRAHAPSAVPSRRGGSTLSSVAASSGSASGTSGAASLEPAAVDREARYRPEDDAITRRWWFWTGAAIVVGGGALAGYAIWEPAPVAVAGPDTWSVRVDGL